MLSPLPSVAAATVPAGITLFVPLHVSCSVKSSSHAIERRKNGCVRVVLFIIIKNRYRRDHRPLICPVLGLGRGGGCQLVALNGDNCVAGVFQSKIFPLLLVLDRVGRAAGVAMWWCQQAVP